MKVLVISRIKDMYYSLPPEVMMDMVQGAIAFIKEHRGTGKCQEIFSVPGQDMSISIFNYDSLEDMDEMLSGFALATYMDFELHLLADFDKNMKRTMDILQSLTGKS